MLRPLLTHRTQSYQYAMRNTSTTVILSVVATALVFGIGACITIKPFTAIGLAPVLAAISLIIRAIRGRPTHPHESPKHPHNDPADMTAQPCQVPDSPTHHSSDVGMTGPTEQTNYEMTPQGLDPQCRADATSDGILTTGDLTDVAQPIPDLPTAATGERRATNPRRGFRRS